MPQETLSLDEARRIALASQGFDRPRPAGRVNVAHLRRVIRQLGLLQIDFVNVLVPAHYQVPFARLGPYQRQLLDDLVYRRGEFTEQWAHEASILPVETWPLLRHRMDVRRVRPYGFEAFMQKQPEYVAWVLEQVRLRGPLSADELREPEGMARRIAGFDLRGGRVDSWIGTVPRAVLEAHFTRGLLAVAERRANFARVFDLAERLVPREHHGREVSRDEAVRAFVLLAARAHGIATAGDLADYYRMSITQARSGIADLVSAGELRAARVEGWREPAYLHPQARLPARIDAAALLSPFDPLVWHRPRVARLFNFDYRIEIFVPAEKRRWGYYVLPFLLGDRLVARADLKADRPGRKLLVPAAYLERSTEAGHVAAALARELRLWATWLGLDAIVIGRRGNLARKLADALRRGS
jgi:uncharacterized protein YcaQ